MGKRKQDKDADVEMANADDDGSDSVFQPPHANL
jgi:hypothetical protein